MDLLVMFIELILASEAGLMVFAAEVWAFEVLEVDAMLGRIVTFQVAHAFGGGFAINLEAFIISWLAVMGIVYLMPKKVLKAAPIFAIGLDPCCPFTISHTAAKIP